MATSSKPVVGVLGSDSIVSLNLDMYVDKDSCGQVVSGGLNAVDTIAERWAKDNGKEFLAFLPNYKTYGHARGKKIRNQELVEFVDKFIYFWDNKDSSELEVIRYATRLGVPCRLNVIEEI